MAAGLAVLVLPAAVRTEGAVVASGLAGALLLMLGVVGWLPLPLGRAVLEGGVLTASTVRGVRRVDLARLRRVGAYEMRTRDSHQDLLSLADADGGWLIVIGQPGFPDGPGPYDRTTHQVAQQVLDAVTSGEVDDVSQQARKALGLPSAPDLAEGVFAAACWVCAVLLLIGVPVGVIGLWGLLVPL